MSESISRIEAQKLTNEFLQETARTASIEPDASYLVGSISAMLEHVIANVPAAQVIIYRHVQYLKTQPSTRP